MKISSLLKRFVPFVAALAIGVFVASFFVTVAAPSFDFRSSRHRHHREYHRQMKLENQQLRIENERLRERLMQAEKHDWVLEPDFDVAPPPPAVAPLNAAPRTSR